MLLATPLRRLGFLAGFGLLGLFATPALAQTPGVGIGATTFTPDASAVLELKSVTQGLLAPRMTAQQRTAISNPAQGLLVYQTDGMQQGLWQNQGTAAAPNWQRLGADGLGNHTATQNINLGLYKLTGNGGTVGIGVTANGGLEIGDTNTSNLFIGFKAGSSQTTGLYNHFVGYQSGWNNTTGTSNHFDGFQSGVNNTTGGSNYFSGYMTGYSSRIASFNHFVGYQAGKENTTGSFNYFSGYQSGYYNTEGSLNHFNGSESGYLNTTGAFNVFVGYQSGYFNTTGSSNLALGHQAGPMSGNLTNAGAIGYKAKVSQSNSLVLGGTGPDAVKVGIGNTAPSEALDVTGNVKISGAGNGLKFPDGTTQTTAATTGGAAATASNGLTSTGNDIALGGALTGATQVVTGGNPLTFLHSNGTAMVDQSSLSPGPYLLSGGGWQSFTAGRSGELTQLDVRMRNNTNSATVNLTIALYPGTGTSNAALVNFGQSVTLGQTGTVVTLTFPTPPTVAAGSVYTVLISGDGAALLEMDANNPYPGGVSSWTTSYDLRFQTHVRTGVQTALALATTGNVGVGTSSPTQKLEVAGNVKLSGTGSGLIFPDGSTQTTAATAGSATTASNGLTKTGDNIALGGTLGTSTHLSLGTNNMTFLASGASSTLLDQNVQSTSTSGLGLPASQSFTAGMSGELARIDVKMRSFAAGASSSVTFEVFAGSGTGGTRVANFSQVIAVTSGGTVVGFNLPAGVTVTAGSVYTFQISNSTNYTVYTDCANPYAGGQMGHSASCDMVFQSYVRNNTVTALALSGSNVGVGTASPTQKLEVAGNVQISGAGNGLRFPDNTVQTTAAPVTPTASNGLTKSSSNVFTLGGTLTGSTNLALAANTLSLTGGNVGIGTSNATSPLTVGGSLAVAFVETGANDFTLTHEHQTVRRVGLCNKIILPAASSCPGRLYTIINSNSGSGPNLTLTTADGSTISDDVTLTAVSPMASRTRLTLQSSGTGWYVISRN